MILSRDATISDVAYGDLNNDGIDDTSVLMAARGADLKRRYLLMVYFGDHADVHFVDAEVLSYEQEITQIDDATVDIKSSIINVAFCCGNAPRRIKFALQDRELSRVRQSGTT